MTTLFAINRVTRPIPGATGLKSVGFDDNGEPIMRVQSESLMPGDIFEHDDAEAAELLEMGIVRHPTEAELLIHKKANSK